MDGSRWTAWQCRDGRLGDVAMAMVGLAMDGLAIKRWTSRQCRNRWLGNVVMNSSRWTTACNGRLGDKALDGSAMDSLAMDGSGIKRWTARRCLDGQLTMDDDSSMMQQWMARNRQLAKNGLAMKRWTARRCCDGRLAMDSSTQWTARQWTACDGQLGNKALDGLVIKRWKARQCRDGQLTMDGLAMERWTAR